MIEISEEQIKFMQKYYPALEKIAYNRLVRYCISFLKEITESGDMDNSAVPILQRYVRKGYPYYLLSNYKITNKMFGLAVCFNYKMACKIYDCLR